MRNSASLFSALAMLLAACGYDQESFTATLNGGNVAPTPVVTATTGTFTANVEGPVAAYTLSITGTLDSITAAHIHTGAAGTAGGVWVFLYDGATTGIGFTGVLSKNTFNQATVAACTPGCAGGGSFDNIVAGMRGKTVYVNVHTRANPGGHIRGNF